MTKLKKLLSLVLSVVMVMSSFVITDVSAFADIPDISIIRDGVKTYETLSDAVSDALTGETILINNPISVDALVTIPEDKSLTIEELRNYCANHPMLPPYKRPKYYTFVDELPHTATGKLKHYALRKLAKKS